jgi:hypothetical protein
MRKGEKDEPQKHESVPDGMSSFNNRENNRPGSIEEVEGESNETPAGLTGNEDSILQPGTRKKEDQKDA